MVLSVAVLTKHYHAIMMFSKPIDWTLIQSAWNKGIVDIRSFSSARAGYVAKYSVKQLELDYEGRERPFHLQSKGLGDCFLVGKSFATLNYSIYWRNLSGRRIKLPRYYIDKLGTWRTTQKWKDDDGNVFTRSRTYHNRYYLRMKEKSYNDFIEKDSINRSRFGNTASSYDLWLYHKADKLEHELINLSKKSSYYELTRQGY